MGSGHPKYEEFFGKYVELKKETEALIKVFDQLPELKSA
jgi:hypothetical protein